jgi:secreted trypsin-like serine protease
LFNDKDYKDRFGYFCGGVIVSSTRVITAAHCIYNTKRTLLARNILVMLGGHDLDDRFEIGKLYYPVRELLVHSDWNPRTTKFDADIALLDLDSKITFGTYIQPICLVDPSLENSLPSEGVVTGYGKSEDPNKNHETIPRHLKVNIVSNEDCWEHEPSLIQISSKRTFCAGTLSNGGACKGQFWHNLIIELNFKNNFFEGDSGGGLFVIIRGKQYLRGLVSSTLLHSDSSCNVDTYSVFTDVLKFRDFIQGPISSPTISPISLLPADSQDRVWT